MAFYVPKIGDQLPRNGGAFRRWFGRTALRIWGWKFTGELPNIPKFVHIVAPHTSNWDFPVGVWARMAMGLDMAFLGKEALFSGIQGVIMRKMGGIPVSLTQGLGMTDWLAEDIREAEKYILTITPEGSRDIRTTWRTGYYFIALKAEIPIVMVSFDFKDKIIEYGPVFSPTGSFDEDVKMVNDFYQDKIGLYPELFRLHETSHPVRHPICHPAAEPKDILPATRR